MNGYKSSLNLGINKKAFSQSFLFNYLKTRVKEINENKLNDSYNLYYQLRYKSISFYANYTLGPNFYFDYLTLLNQNRNPSTHNISLNYEFKNKTRSFYDRINLSFNKTYMYQVMGSGKEGNFKLYPRIVGEKLSTNPSSTHLCTWTYPPRIVPSQETWYNFVPGDITFVMWAKKRVPYICARSERTTVTLITYCECIYTRWISAMQTNDNKIRLRGAQIAVVKCHVHKW